MNKRIFLSLSVLCSLCFILFTACNDDDDDKAGKPTISDFVVGSSHDNENDGIGYVGGNPHMEAEITAPAKIEKIVVEIHQEDVTNGYEIDSTYTQGYAGTLNADFHSHINIPVDAPVGEYHLHFTVYDQAGQSTTTEKEIQIKTK